MNGQRYLISNPTASSDINIGTSGSPVDLLALTASGAVPFYLENLEINSAVNAAQIQKSVPVHRSSPGSGAAGSLGTRNASPAGPAASTTCNYGISTPGALSGTPVWSSDWQQFGSFEMDRRDEGHLVPAGITFAITLPVVSVSFTCNINGQILEVK